MNPNSHFRLSDHLEKLSKDGNPLEVLDATIDFEYFRSWLLEGLGYGPGGMPLPMIVIPSLGYKSHISIDRRFGSIREATVTSATAPDGRQLRHVVSTDNAASDVCAGGAYRSQANEVWLVKRMFTSRIDRKKPKGNPMAEVTRRANAKKSVIRAKVEHIFAHQKIALACSYARLAWCGQKPN